MAGYLDPNQNIGIYSALSAIKPDSTEMPVQILWQVLIPTAFPSQLGFKYGFKSPVLATNHLPDVVVFKIIRTGFVQRQSTDCVEKQIFFVECKAPYLDRPGAWYETGNGQLVDYMMNSTNAVTTVNTGAGPRRAMRAYGAVAIGSKVQFYKFDSQAARRLTPLHPRPFEMNNAADRRNIEAQLDNVRANGWAWVG